MLNGLAKNFDRVFRCPLIFQDTFRLYKKVFDEDNLHN